MPWQLPHRVLPLPPHRLQGLATTWRAKGGPADVRILLSGCAGGDSNALTFQLPMKAAPPASAAVPMISRCIQGRHDAVTCMSEILQVKSVLRSAVLPQLTRAPLVASDFGDTQADPRSGKHGVSVCMFNVRQTSLLRHPLQM